MGEPMGLRLRSTKLLLQHMRSLLKASIQIAHLCNCTHTRTLTHIRLYTDKYKYTCTKSDTKHTHAHTPAVQ